MKRAIAILCLLIGCGDDTMSASPDAAIDAPHPDAAMPDATAPDAGPTFSGLVLIADFKVQGHDELGHGGVIDIRFAQNGTGPVPQTHVDATQGGLGCTADLFAAADANQGPGLAEGRVQITGMSAAIPDCTFGSIANEGYRCVGQSGPSTIAIAPGGGSTAQVTVNNATFSNADAGRYLDIRGDTTFTSNNGRFPIIQTISATQVLIGHPAPQVNTFSGNYMTVAGAGPVPNGPAFLEATDNVSVSLAVGGGNDFPPFTQTGMHGVAPFHLTTVSAALMTAIPANGNAVTLECDINAGACDGTLTLVSIDTTDGAVGSLPPYVMPPATGHVARVNCAFIGRTADIPANIMQVVMQAAPTRIQTFFVRLNLAMTSDTNQTTFVLGRGIAGYTTP
jgi:hypothetical protein